MAITTKNFDINNFWTLVAQNTKQAAILSNLSTAIDVFVGQSAPAADTPDYVTIAANEDFNVAKLVDNADRVYVRTNGVAFVAPVKVIIG